MFGKIMKLEEKLVKVENTKKIIQTNILNYHVVFESNNGESILKIIGEIVDMNVESFSIALIGEIKNNFFIPGKTKYPSIFSLCRFINKEELELIIGSQDYMDKENIYLGDSSLYEEYKITAKLNDFLNQHFVMVGNSGYGKSCGVASFLQNLFYYNNKIPKYAHIILFDVYGEYRSALAKMETISDVHVKYYSTGVKESNTNEIVCIPAYFLGVDDLALLLNITDPTLLPILEKTLKYVAIFKQKTENSTIYKNSIIANCLIEILGSGKSANQLRDQIISVLNKYHTTDLNLESQIVQPGYTRTLKQCLQMDSNGKIGALSFVIEFLNTFISNKVMDTHFEELTYTMQDIYDALEFALISEGILNNEALYDKANELKIRMHSIINSEKNKFFDYKNGYIAKEQFVKSMFLNANNEYVQIINMNFNFIEENFAKVLTKLYMKLFFDFAVSLKQRASFPINVIIEEAHRYVQNDNDIHVIGYNIFDRITKEGRKYGVLLGFITQRPSELSTTCLSQCSNFLIFRVMHPDDLKVIASMSSNLSNRMLEKIKALSPGNALAFGSAFKIPLLIKFSLPNPMPSSTNISLDATWYE